MSINVTVHGNPISVSRGKMVSFDADKEFALRRKIRLQQVRQQSKEIAEDVRNRVRKEKNKQLSKAEKVAEQNLKKQQQQQLSSLKKQYQDCLEEFGAAYNDADSQPSPSSVIDRVVLQNRNRAAYRGQKAVEKHKSDQKLNELKSKKHINVKKDTRKIEDLRSKLVSNLKNNKTSPFKKRRKKSTTNITINGISEIITDESDVESEYSNLSVLGETSPNSSCNSNCIVLDSEGNSFCSDENSFLNRYSKSTTINNGRKNISFPDDLQQSDFISHQDNHSNNVEYNTNELENIDPQKVLDNSHKDIHTDRPKSGNAESFKSHTNILNRIKQRINVADPRLPAPLSSRSSEQLQMINNIENLNGQNSTTNIRLNNNDDMISQFSSKCETQKNTDGKSPNKPQMYWKSNRSIHNDQLLRIQEHRRQAGGKTIRSKGTVLKSPDKSEPSSLKKKSIRHSITSKSPAREKETHLPYIPTVSLRPENMATQTSVVDYHDYCTNKHCNCYNIDQSRSTLIQKISKDSLEMHPTDDEEEEYREKMARRDEEARIRGIKALEKNKIRRDYQQLMEELPLLKRQEQLAAMNNPNQPLHMSDERYQDLERMKQNRMENAYENLQSQSHETPLITLKPERKLRPHSDIKKPFKTLDVTDSSPPVLNVGSWENVDSSTSQTSIITPETSASTTTTGTNKIIDEIALTELLKRINKQRNLLIKEAANLPSVVSLKSVLNEQELLNLLCPCPPEYSQSKVLKEVGTSPLISKEIEKKKKLKKPKESGLKTSKNMPANASKTSSKRMATSTPTSSDTSVEMPQRKSNKVKSKKSNKRQKIIIREEGTQTSPAIIPCGRYFPSENEKREESTQTVPLDLKYIEDREKRSGRDVSDTHRLTEIIALEDTSNSNSDKLCEIIIKSTDNKDVQISHRADPKLPTSVVVEERVFTNKKNHISNVIIKIKEPKEKTQLKNGDFETSTSTSYFSPPLEMIKSVEKSVSKSLQFTERLSNKELLNPQKQQTNINQLVHTKNGGDKEINPRLLRYIKKLLNMSRQSIDDLTISSVSDVSTPNDSVVLTSRNQAREQLQNVMGHFNLSPDDIKRYISSGSFTTSEGSLENEILELMKPIVLNSSGEKSPLRSFSTGISTIDPEMTTKEPQKVTKPKSPEKNTSVLQPKTHKREGHDLIKEDSESLKKFDTEKHVVSPSAPKQNITSPRRNSPEQGYLILPKETTDGLSMEYQNVLPQCPKDCYEFCDCPSHKIPSSTKDSEAMTMPSTSKQLSSEGLLDKKPKAVRNVNWEEQNKFLEFLRQNLCMTTEEFDELGIWEMFSKNAELTEYCHERIQSLMQLIEKVRNDKRQIYSPEEPSISITTYKDLPSKHSQQARGEESKKNGNDSSGSSSSLSQEAVDRYLLGIDKNEESISKYKKLSTQDDHVSEGIQNNLNIPETFVPMLQGIPKYFDNSTAQQTELQSVTVRSGKLKPPPSLIRANMRGYVDVVPHELSTIVEAETIISSRNTSIQVPQSPEKIPSRNVSPKPNVSSPKQQKSASPKQKEIALSKQKNIASPKQRVVSPKQHGTQNSRGIEISQGSHSVTKDVDQSRESSTRSDSAGYVTISPERPSGRMNEEQRIGPLTPRSPTSTAEFYRARSAMSGVHPLSDSTNRSHDELEMLLRKFKLDWAISLVKKTEQSLALSSSSSASEIGQRTRSSNISITDVYKHLYQKLTSSSGGNTEIENTQVLSDLSSHFRDVSDISGIPVVASSRAEYRVESRNRSQQRTSTPVQQSKSFDSKSSHSNEFVFKGDSEISSVRNSTDDMFLSVPNVTLNTTNCSLNKSKK